MDNAGAGAYLRVMHALIDTRRAVLSVSGPEAREFLQGILTQDMSKVSRERAAYAALLTPQGKIMFDFFILEDEDGYLIDIRAERAADLLKRLKLYRLRAKVELADRPETSVLLGWGGEAPAPAGFVIDPAPGRIAYVDPRLDAMGVRVLVDRETREAALADLGAEASLAAYDANRFALGVPESGVDILPERSFPLDLNFDALHGVDYKKGCFVGQEVTSRMKRKGEVRKRTLIVALDSVRPEPGDAITAGETTLGEVLSAGAMYALALIRMDRLTKAIDEGYAPHLDAAPVALKEPGYLV